MLKPFLISILGIAPYYIAAYSRHSPCALVEAFVSKLDHRCSLLQVVLLHGESGSWNALWLRRSTGDSWNWSIELRHLSWNFYCGWCLHDLTLWEFLVDPAKEAGQREAQDWRGYGEVMKCSRCPEFGIFLSHKVDKVIKKQYGRENSWFRVVQSGSEGFERWSYLSNSQVWCSSHLYNIVYTYVRKIGKVKPHSWPEFPLAFPMNLMSHHQWYLQSHRWYQQCIREKCAWFYPHPLTDPFWAELECFSRKSCLLPIQQISPQNGSYTSQIPQFEFNLSSCS